MTKTVETDAGLLIIGGGAAGMAAAAEAARRGVSVTLLERMDRVGKKLLATGNGRCNLMNAGAPCYPRGQAFAEAVLAHCGAAEQQAFWQNLGLTLRREEAGRVYPASGQASTVLDALRFALERYGVKVRTGFEAASVKREYGTFLVRTPAGETLRGRSLLIAAGGAAQPKLGSNGTGAALLASLGHRVTPPLPALTQLICDTAPIAGLSGIRVKAEVCLMRGERLIHREPGEVLFTDYGLSGVVILNTSSHAEPGDRLALNLLPGMGLPDAPALESELNRRREAWPDEPAERLLLGLCVPRLANAVCRAAGIRSGGRTLRSLSSGELAAVTKAADAFPLRVKGLRGLEFAQVTRGGADPAGFDPATMESRLIPGLHAAGEALDVDGACGGFNLMFAFAGGILAGRAAAAE